MENEKKSILSWFKLFKEKGESVDIIAFIAGIFFFFLGINFIINTSGIITPLLFFSIGYMFIRAVNIRIHRDKEKKVEEKIPEIKKRSSFTLSKKQVVLVIVLLLVNVVLIVLEAGLFTPLIVQLPLLALAFPIALGEIITETPSRGYFYFSLILLSLLLFISLSILLFLLINDIQFL